jgi:hypothetical protein
MKIYNRKGMLVIPTPPRRVENIDKELLLVKECFCQNGHNLISKRVNFSGFNGIFLKVRKNLREGFVGLSPVYGEKCRISMDLDLRSGELWQLLCPICEEELPVFSTCNCGARIMTLFLDQRADYSNCIGICNRVNCANSVVKSEGDLLFMTMLNSARRKSGMRFFRELDA